jgi:predicted alpha/beta hydrolase family esterase
MKNAFIIHGFNGDTTYTFGPHLKSELEKRNYNVIMPIFPIRTEASYLGWSSILNQYKDFFNEDTIIVCHSIGNPFIIKYISENNLKAKLYVSVAGFCKLFKVPAREDLNKAFIDFEVKQNNINYCKNNIQFRYSLYSDNDHVIPFDILEDFINKLSSTPVFISGVRTYG